MTSCHSLGGSMQPRIRAGRLALATVSAVAAGSMVLSSGYYSAIAQTPTPTSSDTHTTAPPSTPPPPAPDTHTTEPAAPDTHTAEPAAPDTHTAEPAAPDTHTAEQPSTSTTPEHPSVLGEATGPTCTHTVVSGDTLSAIAARNLGNANRFNEIYKANQALIEAEARKHPDPPVNGTSDGGHWIFPGEVLIIPGASCAPSPAQQTSTTCTHGTVLIGLRGSNETQAANANGDKSVGDVVGALAGALRRSENRDPNGTTVIGVPYPAKLDLSYRDSVSQGVAMTVAILTAHAKCTDEKILLAGYSQGAEVVRRALASVSPEIRARVSGIALFGDPTRDEKDRPNGPSARSLGVSFSSYCNGLDPVCSTRDLKRVYACATGDVNCTHFKYVPAATDDAATFLSGRPLR
ncbi:cutinase family protein [Streptomyces canus]|uniref:cutinase family protein n=1 Tax=Streptomyces canus TaxID=58343 RepID=UPI0036EAA871